MPDSCAFGLVPLPHQLFPSTAAAQAPETANEVGAVPPEAPAPKKPSATAGSTGPEKLPTAVESTSSENPPDSQDAMIPEKPAAAIRATPPEKHPPMKVSTVSVLSVPYAVEHVPGWQSRRLRLSLRLSGGGRKIQKIKTCYQLRGCTAVLAVPCRICVVFQRQSRLLSAHSLRPALLLLAQPACTTLTCPP